MDRNEPGRNHLPQRRVGLGGGLRDAPVPRPILDDESAWDLRPTCVEIDLDALRHNIALTRGLIGPDTKLFAVCKADGYGCGAAEVAKVAEEAGADALSVGDPWDARKIRSVGVRLPMLLYGSTLPTHLAAVARLSLIVTLHDFDGLRAACAAGMAMKVFVKLDCGLGRLGFLPSQWSEAFRALAGNRQITVAGVYTHLSSPDDEAVTAAQSRLFSEGCDAAVAAGLRDFDRMVASSRVMLGYPDLNLTAVNPGRLLYGTLEGHWLGRLPVQPVVRSVKSKVIQVKEVPAGGLVYGEDNRSDRARRVAILPIGFGDGFPQLPPCHELLIEGCRAPILGRRAIEHMVADVSNIPEARVGSEAVLLGEQGGESITIEELAHALRVSVFELAPKLARAGHRIFLGER